jgi:hypothetical protein
MGLPSTLAVTILAALCGLLALLDLTSRNKRRSWLFSMSLSQCFVFTMLSSYVLRRVSSVHVWEATAVLVVTVLASSAQLNPILNPVIHYLFSRNMRETPTQKNGSEQSPE